MNANEISIVCRSLRQLDALIDVHLFGFKLPNRSGVVHNPPHYTTWAGMEPVIRLLESRGLLWDISLRHPGQSDAYYAEIFMGKTIHSRYARTAPIALCLAALASAGVRVRLELGEDQ